MDPAATIIKSINQLLSVHIEDLNQKFNKDLTPLIDSIEDIKYSKFRQCLIKKDANKQKDTIPQCFSEVQHISINVDFETPNKKLMACVDLGLEEVMNGKVRQPNELIKKCVGQYGKKVQEDTRREIDRMMKLIRKEY